MMNSQSEIEPSEYDILIVDDNPENLKVLGGFLLDQGFNVRAARDGKQALESVEAAPPELILMDIHMPVMDGYEACRRLKAHKDFQNIPIIFLSALGETFNKVRAFQLGGADYIVKPFELEEVRMRVNIHLMANRLLAESRAGFRASFEQAAVGMAHLSLEGRVIAVNQSLCDMLGFDHDGVFARASSDVFPAALNDRIREEARRFETGETEASIREFKVVAGDGTPCWCKTTFSLVQVSAARAPYLAIIVQDVTERKSAEMERHRLVAALEQAPDGIVITDEGGRILYVNKAWEDGQVRTRSDLIGEALALLTPSKGDVDGDCEAIRKGVAEKGLWNGRTTGLKNGKKAVEEHHVSAVTAPDGTVTNYVVATRDITRQLRLEDQLRQSQKMEAIGTLAAGIAHDFNNLLAAITGFTELTLDDLPADTEVSANLREVVGAAGRARELVQQILAFGRQSEYQVRPILLQDAIDEVLRLLRRTIPPTIEIHGDLDRECPPVLADATAFHQILMNLGTNAYHAMEEKGGVLSIRLSYNVIEANQLQGHPDLPPGEYARIAVSDTGHGMDLETRERIFEPYFTTKERGGGTGLGLATVHGIVSDLQGAINVYSEPGTGSTFSVLLPTAAASGAEVPLDPIKAPPGRNERVLFVDDESAICRFAEKALERLGYQATVVSDPERALEMVQADPSGYDVVITDEMMPNMRGSELLVGIRAAAPNVPVILYSGFAGSSNKRLQQEGLFDGYVMKPMVTSELSKAIRQVLDTPEDTK